MTRTASMLTIGLALTACACHRAKPSDVSASKPGIESRTTYGKASSTYSRKAKLQVLALRWNRPGDWTPIKVGAADQRLSAALVARDRFGDRVLALRPSAGYNLQLVRIDCEHHGIALLEQRDVSGDGQAADPAKTGVRPTPVATTPIEISRICTKAPAVTHGTPAQAATGLRTAGSRAAAPPPPLNASERERMWREYRARSAAAK